MSEQTTLVEAARKATVGFLMLAEWWAAQAGDIEAVKRIDAELGRVDADTSEPTDG